MPSARQDRLGRYGVGLDISSTLEAAGIIGLWRYDVDRGLVFSDRAMAVAYGVAPSLAVRGVPPSAFRRAIHPDDLPVALAALKGAIDEGCEYQVRYRLVDRDDTVIVVEARGRPLLRDGRTVSVTGANLDVTHALDVREADPLGVLADIAMEVAELAGAIDNPRISAASKRLLIEVGSEMAVRLIDRPEGSA